MPTRWFRAGCPRGPPWYRSGAAARYQAPASQSAWRRKSWLMPNTSWMTTTPGHGPGPLGSQTYACIGPFAVGIAISVIADQHSLPWWGRVGFDDQCSAQRYRYRG